MILFDDLKKVGSSLLAKSVFLMMLCLACLGQVTAQNVAKIGDTHYTTLDAAVDAVQANETIEILVDSCGITNTKVIPAGVTIQGLGKTSTIVTIASTSGSGLTLNNANVTLRDMTIDGSQITSGGYKTLVNVRADGCLITDVVMKKGGQSTWNSSILVETLPSTATFTVSNSTISGSFRGVLRESCNANIVITNCDITATYPFNIDGGSGGTVTVTGGALHGWTSYSGVDQVTFTNVTFSKANSGYDCVASYVNTTFNECTMDNTFDIYAQTSNFGFNLNDCTKGGTVVTNENFTELFPNDPDVWNKCLTTVNEVALVSKQAQVTEALANATIEANPRMTKSFEFDGALCGPAADKVLNHNCDTYTLTMKNNGDRDVTLTTTGGNTTMHYTCPDGSIVNVTNASVAISEGTTFTVTDQTTFFKAADGYFLVETDNGSSFTYSVGTLADKVARIGDGSLGTQYFTTLDAAVTAASSTAPFDTIVILQDIADLPQQTIDKDITINLNNHTLSGSTGHLLKVEAGNVTIKHGTIASSVPGVVSVYGTANLKMDTCHVVTTTTENGYAINHAGTGTINLDSCTINAQLLAVSSSAGGTLNATNCNITTTAGGTDGRASAIRNETGSMFFVNCNITAAGSSCAIYNSSTIVDINGGTVTSNLCNDGYTITSVNGTVNIYGDVVINTCCKAIKAAPNPAGPAYISTIPVNVNIGGYEDEYGNLVVSGHPQIIVGNSSLTGTELSAVAVYYHLTSVRIFGDAAITTTNPTMESVVVLKNGGNVKITGGTITSQSPVITTAQWNGDQTFYEGKPNKVEICDTAQLISSSSETVKILHGDHYNTDIDIHGGVFSDDVSGEKCREGYAAFPLESNPGHFYVAPSYAIFLMANNGTTDKDTCYVRQTTGSGVLKANAFVHSSALTFSRWNTKADGSGTDFNNRATISGLTRDTTLYAIWTGEVAKINGTPYASLQAAVNAASAMTGDVTIELVDNTSESVLIRQKAGLNITINGADHTVTGQIIIDGMGGSSNTETLLIENIHFVYDADYIDDKTDAFVIMPNAKDASASWFTSPDHYNYAHHVTVQNCTFDGEGSNNGIAGVKVPSQGAYDVTVDHCTASNMHSLAQFNSTQGVAITNCRAIDNVKNGANIVGGGGTITVTNNEITTLTGGDQYGIRIKGGSTGDKDVALADNTVEAPVAIVLANTVPDHTTINVTGGTYIGDIDDSDNGETFNISGGTFSEDVSGEPCAEGYAAFANGTTPETWTVGQYSVKYFANDGTDNYVAVPLAGSFPVSVTIADPFGTTADFIIWNTAADGTGTYYNEDQSVTLTQSLDLYLQHVVAKIGSNYYTSIQAALDTARNTLTGDVTIELLNNATGYSIVHQKAGLNLTIEGNEHFLAGQIIVDGNARAAGTETLTIQNVKFQDDKSHFYTGTDAFILVPSCKTAGTPYYTNAYNYAHNITVDHCSFTSTSSSLDVVGFKATSGAGNYNTVMTNVTGDNLHSLAQMTGTTGSAFDHCVVTNSNSYINIDGGAGAHNISNCTFSSDLTGGYAIREKSSSTAVITLSDNDFSAEKVLQLGKNDAPQGRINVVSGTYNGTIFNNQTAAGTATFSFTGGTFTNLGGADDAADSTNVKAKCAEGYGCYKDVAGYPTGWTVLKMYWVTYDANGGSGTPMTPSYVAPIPGSSFTVKENEYDWNVDFTNWNTKADGTGDPYDENATMTIFSDTILYAQWDVVAKIGVIPYSSLQTAIDDANANMTGDVTINLMKNTSEVVTVLQKAENNLTINGNGNTLTGQMFISSNQEGNIWNGTDKINITNLKFAYDENYFNLEGSTDYWKTDGFIVFCRNCFFTSKLNYAHNVTISDCEFDGAGSTQKIYAVKSGASGGVNKVVLENCTAKNVLGLAELQSTANFTVTGCTATENVDRGLYIAGSVGNHHITNNTITATEYAVHIQYQTTTGTTDSLSGNTFEAPVVFKLDHNESPNVTLDITSGTYKGTINDQDASTIFNISGGTYSEDVSGEPCTPGYAAFDNGDGTWTVTKAWFLYYDKNHVTAVGTMDTLFVRQDGTDVERTVEVAACEFTCLPDSAFDRWNTQADGLGVDVSVGTELELTSDVTLYAIWKEGFTIFYNNNGGTGEIANQSKDPGVDVTLSDGAAFTKTDSTLYRWNTAEDESGTNYKLGGTYSEDANVTMYAVWRLNLGMTMSSTDVVCYGENNGTDTVKIIGGEAPYQIVLSGGALTDNVEVTTNQTTHIFTDLKPSANAYKVQLTDVLTKDTIRTSFTISQPDTLVITAITVPERPCPLMGTGTYEVAMTTTGGNGGNTITWGGDATDANALATTITPDADDRDRTYNVTVTVTDSKGCMATGNASFSVAPVIANDGSAHSNTTMTIAPISKGILTGCDTIIRDFGTPAFVFTNPDITKNILDTIYNNVSTVAPDSIFAVGTHEILWTAIDTCGHIVTATQTLEIFYLPCPTVTDYDGNSYRTVRIACDCWMAENLRSNNYEANRPIPNVMHYSARTRAIDYNGNLYDWYAVMDAGENGTNSVSRIEAAYAAGESVRGVCPEGWHVPTEAEVEALMAAYSPEELMAQGVWIPDNGTNASGFNMLPSGIYNDVLNRYESKYVNGYFWILTPPTSVYHACEFGSACSTMEIIPGSLKAGYSVRCVIDKE